MGRFEVGVKSIVIYNRKALLVQRPNAIWEFPGGHLEFGEDLHTALRREIEEETGLRDIRIEKLLYAVTIQMSAELQAVGLLYLSGAQSGKVVLSSEHVDFVWVDKERMVNLLNKRMMDEITENCVLDTLDID